MNEHTLAKISQKRYKTEWSISMYLINSGFAKFSVTTLIWIVPQNEINLSGVGTSWPIEHSYPSPFKTQHINVRMYVSVTNPIFFFGAAQLSAAAADKGQTYVPRLAI